MSSYLGVVVFFILLTEARLEATFQLTRGLKDKFTNPQCVKNTVCSVGQCAQYFARCETDSCTVCVCDEQSPTYVANQKRCVKDDDIIPQTVPKYSSFVISNPNGQPYLAAETTSNKLDYENQYTGNPNQLWLYTPSKKLLNLKTLECLDAKDHFRVALRQCTVDKNETQMWHCSTSADKLYGIYGGAKLYLDFTGSHFYMGDDLNYKWIANKGAVSRSICDIPDTYKGCYRFTDGAAVKRFSRKPQIKNCTEKYDAECYQKYQISAPIFSCDDQRCYIVWHDSYFSVNDQPWKNFHKYENDFDHTGLTLQPGVVEFRFHENAKRVWAGVLMKLEVQCQSDNPFTQRKVYENHCILIKFDGMYNESLQEHPQTSTPTKTHERLTTPAPTRTSDSRKSKGESSKPNLRYKSSVIALSVVLTVVLLIVIVVTVIVYKRRHTRAWVATNGVDDDVSAKPFCNTEDRF